MEDSSFLTSVSEITPVLSGASQSDHNSQTLFDFDVILQDIVEKAKELESLGRHLLGKKFKRTSRQHSNTGTEDFADILIKTGLVLKLTETLENADRPLGVPKCTLLCQNLLYDLLLARCQELEELKKKLEHENAKGRKEIDKLTNLGKHGNDGFGHQDELQSKRQLEAFKEDIIEILNTISSKNGDVKSECYSFICLMVNAYTNNLDGSVEDGYVQLPVNCLNNAGLCCLLQEKMVVQHSQDQFSFRLSFD